jgi:hypothetical protein
MNGAGSAGDHAAFQLPGATSTVAIRNVRLTSNRDVASAQKAAAWRTGEVDPDQTSGRGSGKLVWAQTGHVGSTCSPFRGRRDKGGIVHCGPGRWRRNQHRIRRRLASACLACLLDRGTEQRKCSGATPPLTCRYLQNLSASVPVCGRIGGSSACYPLPGNAPVIG